MKYLPTFENFLNEGISDEAIKIHAITGCGQNAAQDFIDDNRIRGEKLLDYLQRNPNSKFDVRDYISGAAGTVGGDKKLRKSFIDKMK